MLELIIIVTDPFRPDRAMHAYTLLVVGGATLLTVMAQTAYSGPPDAHLADEGLARFPCEYQELIVLAGRAWNVFFSVVAISAVPPFAVPYRAALRPSKAWHARRVGAARHSFVHLALHRLPLSQPCCSSYPNASTGVSSRRALRAATHGTLRSPTLCPTSCSTQSRIGCFLQ
mmetsp:Transcript_29613/g.90846  ORF Transcript_29613/g.90846 Transcript_29613/m.90846 type:complete len:173 (+) Transcript_29613:415-933(+)